VKPQIIELRAQRPRCWQFRRLVSFLLDQLPAKLLRRQPRVQTPIPKLRVRLTEPLGDVLDVGEQIRQLFLGTRSTTGRKGVATNNARPQLVHPFANRHAIPAKLSFGPSLSAISQGPDRPRQEKPTLRATKRSCRFDDIGFEPIREFHVVAPSKRKKQYTNHCRILGYLFLSGSLSKPSAPGGSGWAVAARSITVSSACI
jgi:hypothetical protein